MNERRTQTRAIDAESLEALNAEVNKWRTAADNMAKLFEDAKRRIRELEAQLENERAEVCECGHTAETHSPCCVSACGCDSFTRRRLTLEELFKAVMRDIKGIAKDALGYDQTCEPVQAVRRLAQRVTELEAQLTEALRQTAALKVQLSEEYRDWMKDQCNEECRYGERLYVEAIQRAEAAKALVEAYKRDSEALGQQLENAIDAAIAAEVRAEAMRKALEAYPEWMEGPDEDAYGIGTLRFVTCLACGGGGAFTSSDKPSKRTPPTHKPDCARQAALAPTPAAPPQVFPWKAGDMLRAELEGKK